MECPFCHSQLEAGALWTARDPVYWFPRGGQVFFPTKKRLEKAGALRVAYYPGHERKQAFLCRTCRRMIVTDV